MENAAQSEANMNGTCGLFRAVGFFRGFCKIILLIYIYYKQYCNRALRPVTRVLWRAECARSLARAPAPPRPPALSLVSRASGAGASAISRFYTRGEHRGGMRHAHTVSSRVKAMQC